jgi:uncharacterized glyoxalase superfamily protein PhnB
MFKQLTPNLMTDNMNATIEFYKQVLGFEVVMNVPEKQPYDWTMLRREKVILMFQTRTSLGEEIAALAELPICGSLTLYIETTDIEQLHQRIKGKAELVQDMRRAFYGMREFAIKDINGYILVFAERGED